MNVGGKLLMGETEQPKYVIKVNGRTVSVPFPSKFLAEQHLGNLPKDQQAIAEIVPVTAGGQEILFG